MIQRHSLNNPRVVVLSGKGEGATLAPGDTEPFLGTSVVVMTWCAGMEGVGPGMLLSTPSARDASPERDSADVSSGGVGRTPS